MNARHAVTAPRRDRVERRRAGCEADAVFLTVGRLQVDRDVLRRPQLAVVVVAHARLLGESPLVACPVTVAARVRPGELLPRDRERHHVGLAGEIAGSVDARHVAGADRQDGVNRIRRRPRPVRHREVPAKFESRRRHVRPRVRRARVPEVRGVVRPPDLRHVPLRDRPLDRLLRVGEIVLAGHGHHVRPGVRRRRHPRHLVVVSGRQRPVPHRDDGFDRQRVLVAVVHIRRRPRKRQLGVRDVVGDAEPRRHTDRPRHARQHERIHAIAALRHVASPLDEAQRALRRRRDRRRRPRRHPLLGRFDRSAFAGLGGHPVLHRPPPGEVNLRHVGRIVEFDVPNAVLREGSARPRDAVRLRRVARARPFDAARIDDRLVRLQRHRIARRVPRPGPVFRLDRTAVLRLAGDGQQPVGLDEAPHVDVAVVLDLRLGQPAAVDADGVDPPVLDSGAQVLREPAEGEDAVRRHRRDVFAVRVHDVRSVAVQRGLLAIARHRHVLRLAPGEDVVLGNLGASRVPLIFAIVKPLSKRRLFDPEIRRAQVELEPQVDGGIAEAEPVLVGRVARLRVVRAADLDRQQAVRQHVDELGVFDPEARVVGGRTFDEAVLAPVAAMPLARRHVPADDVLPDRRRILVDAARHVLDAVPHRVEVALRGVVQRRARRFRLADVEPVELLVALQRRSGRNGRLGVGRHVGSRDKNRARLARQLRQSHRHPRGALRVGDRQELARIGIGVESFARPQRRLLVEVRRPRRALAARREDRPAADGEHVFLAIAAVTRREQAQAHQGILRLLLLWFDVERLTARSRREGDDRPARNLHVPV